MTEQPGGLTCRDLAQCQRKQHVHALENIRVHAMCIAAHTSINDSSRLITGHDQAEEGNLQWLGQI